jgi:DNA-binding NarL/FixJ family response regulator
MDKNEQPITVAVVEDQRRTREGLAALIVGSKGLSVCGQFASMEQALQGLTAPPDVVLLDIGLPGMSGYELAREFSRHPVVSRAKLIALTGYGQPGDTEQAKAAGFAGYLVKPVDVDQLRERIESILAADVAPARR